MHGVKTALRAVQAAGTTTRMVCNHRVPGTR